MVSLTASVHRLVAARPLPAGPSAAGFGVARSLPPLLVDAAVAAAALAGSLALMAHGNGVFHPRSGDVDPVRVALATAATAPLLAWRRSPLGVFAITASASVLLAAVGDVIWPPLGPAAALYLLASSRDNAAPWTPRSASTVVVLLVAGAARAVGAAADQAAYRILQEALTNAARYGTGTARIVLSYTDTALVIAVINPTRAECPTAQGRGHGLVGMRERATLVGGELSTEQSGGTFGVRALIPYTGQHA
jgi:hypothetical protein